MRTSLATNIDGCPLTLVLFEYAYSNGADLILGC